MPTVKLTQLSFTLALRNYNNVTRERIVTHYFARLLGNREIPASFLVLYVADNTRVETAR